MFHPNPDKLTIRREAVFLILAGLFLGSLTMLNLLGVTKFIDLTSSIEDVFGLSIPFRVPIGVLPYPITFLCTDLISELYGKKRANLVVWTGLLLNAWVILIVWLGDIFPGTQIEELNTFTEIRNIAYGSVMASMAAYLAAQFIDVYVFHYLKAKTKGKMLWLRNNGSTLISQMVDTIAVILITYYSTENVFPMKPEYSIATNLIIIIASAYVFKLVAALIDTVPFYLATNYLTEYLELQDVSK